jgi:hypothetical protein
MLLARLTFLLWLVAVAAEESVVHPSLVLPEAAVDLPIRHPDQF